jgi:hypothetical protein
MTEGLTSCLKRNWICERLQAFESKVRDRVEGNPTFSVLLLAKILLEYDDGWIGYRPKRGGRKNEGVHRIVAEPLYYAIHNNMGHFKPCYSGTPCTICSPIS